MSKSTRHNAQSNPDYKRCPCCEHGFNKWSEKCAHCAGMGSVPKWVPNPPSIWQEIVTLLTRTLTAIQWEIV